MTLSQGLKKGWGGGDKMYGEYKCMSRKKGGGHVSGSHTILLDSSSSGVPSGAEFVEFSRIKVKFTIAYCDT